MIMQKSDMEIIEFDAADVITTSSIINPDPIDDAIRVIWLSDSSIDNFNDYSTTDINLSKGDLEGWSYIAFDGTKNKKGTLYTASKGMDDSPDTSRLFVVSSSTDSVGYNRVLTWLVDHSGTHGN